MLIIGAVVAADEEQGIVKAIQGIVKKQEKRGISSLGYGGLGGYDNGFGGYNNNGYSQLGLSRFGNNQRKPVF